MRVINGGSSWANEMEKMINSEQEGVRYKKLHNYFIEEPICKCVDHKEDTKNLLNFAMGLTGIDDELHGEIYDLMSELYKAEEHIKHIPKQKMMFAGIEYGGVLNAVIEILNKVAPENTKITVHNGIYQYREFGIGNKFGPPTL